MQTKDRLILLTILLTGLVACRKEVPADTPLVFTDVQTKVGLSSYYEDFKVWGYCLAESGSDIMPSYKVFHDPVLGWCYTEIDGTEGQELQYWSYSASLYRFHAGAPLSRVKAIDASSLTLEVKATTSISETSLFTEPCLIKRGDAAFGNTVNFAFVYANSRVNVAFKYASNSSVVISDIQLTPPAAYPTRGTIKLDYDWAKGKVRATVSDKTTQSDPLSFPSVNIPARSTTAIETTSPRYMIPDASVKGKWSISMKIDGKTPKQADFTISKAWEPGKSYLYIFEYTDQANLVFIGTNEVIFDGKDLENGVEHNFN